VPAVTSARSLDRAFTVPGGGATCGV
jgi:hypothetical protein